MQIRWRSSGCRGLHLLQHLSETLSRDDLRPLGCLRFSEACVKIDAGPATEASEKPHALMEAELTIGMQSLHTAPMREDVVEFLSIDLDPLAAHGDEAGGGGLDLFHLSSTQRLAIHAERHTE